MIEIFDIKNLDTNDENQNKNIKTKVLFWPHSTHQ